MGDVKTIIIKDQLSSNKQGATRAERSATTTSVIDPKSIRTLASSIEKLITSRKGGLDTSSLEKTLIRVLNASLKATGQTGGISKDDLSRVAKEAGRVIAKEFVNKVISKQTQPGRPSAGPSTSAVTKAIENGIKKAAGIIARETAKASKGNIVIDDKLLAGSIKAAIAPLVPKSLPQTGENITKSFGAVKKLMREINLLSKSIGSMRKSGGGIDVMEMPKVLGSLKKVAADAIELGKALTQTKNSIKAMVGESSDSFKELSTSIDDVKKSVKDMVADVRRKASEDRVAFTKEVFGEVRKVFASKAFKDTELARVIKSLEGKIGTVGDLASSFKSIGAEFKKAVKEGTIKIENIDQIINKFDHLISNLSALPDKMSVEGTISPEYKKFLKTLEGFSKGIKGTISEVKLVIDDSGLKKLQEKGIKIKADIDVNQRSIDVTAQDILKTIQKAVSEAVENALKYPKQLKLDIEAQTLKATLKELESAVSDVSLNRVQKVISELEKSMGSGIERLEYASKKVNDLLEYNASKAAKLRGAPERPKTLKPGLGSKAPIPDRYKLLKESLTIPSYKEKVISTEGVGGIRGTFDELSSRTRITDMNKQLLINAEQGMNELSVSLKRLQKSIIEGLDRTFQEASSGWGVVKTPGEQDPSKIFKRTDRQWTVDIADVSRLQRRFKGVGGGSKELVEAYMKEKTTKMEAPTDMRVMADAIGRWLKQTSESQIKSWDVNIKDVESQLIDIQKSIKGVAPDESSVNKIVSTFGTSLESIFKNTYQRAEARRMMQNEKLVRTITLPLATLTPQGIPSFQTTHGSLRALPKFAQFISGFEELHSRLEKSKALKREKGYAGQIKEVGIMPTDRNLFLAENLASNMIKDLASASKESRAFILSQFKEAGTMRGMEVARSKQFKGSEFEKEVKSFSLNINKVVDAFVQAGSGNLDGLISTLEKMELSAYDLVRSLDQVKFENVYDIYRKILVPETGGGPVERLGKEPRFERSIREYEQAVSQLTGLFPLIERSRPRRALHQSNIVNMLTRTGSIYSGEDMLGPAKQKTLIKDLNLRLGEMVREVQTLQKIHMGESSRLGKLPTGVSALSSLGIPEEQAGKIEEYRKDMFTPGTRFLKELNATAVKMYSDTLSELAPFGAEFQQIGRNISNVTNAMIDITGKAAFPKLVTEKERGIVESGFYGKKGYGFNVIAELRNTAATFEDQVIVSGKLADAVTSAVSVLVAPSPGGRVGASPSETFAVASEEMEIEAGQILKSNVEEAAREFQKILGVPKRYPGRADEALIESVKKVLTVVRGEDIEVQQAKIAETFLNYFGRKFTTRYGAKGVGVTPTRPVGQILGEAYEKYGVKGVQVLTGKEREKAGLGVARLPKSMGELVAEMMEENISALRGKGYSDLKIEETKKLFIESGNKFLLDIFKDLDQGVTTVAGVTKSKKVFEKYKSVMDILYDDSEVVGQFEEISRLKKRWEDALKEQAKFYKEVPIDIRISAHGLAKRGLQTEILETVMNNIIGVGAGQTVLSTRMKQDVYSKLLGGLGQQGLLSQYSGTLGFKGAAKPPEVIAKEMMGKKPYEEARKFKESLGITPGMKLGPEATELISEYDTTMRAALLESTSNYYSEIIDEIGKKRKSLVGEKFIQIIEEPHFDPGWALGQIEKGIKGERLDIPAYSAYATIFGEQSAMMKEIQNTMTLNAKKHWEYLKALQFLNKESTELVANLQKGLETVDIKDIKAFDYSTGIYDKTGDSPRSFKDTILDIEKRPSPFVLGLPTAQREVTEPFYVPGALARETYPEPLVAGERGIGDVSRRLVHVINMAKELQDVLDQPEKFVEAKEIRRALPKIIPQQLKVFWKAVHARAETPELEAAAQELINKWFGALSGVKGTRVDQIIAPGFQDTEQDYVSNVLKRQLGKVQAGEKTKLAAYTTTLGAMSDLLIGPSPGTVKKFPEKAKASKIMETYISIGKGGEFAQTLGVDLSENAIKRGVENLEKAKIDYYNVLAETALGKKGSVEEVFFSRKIPAIMGKAVTAVVDKTESLKNFAKELDKIEKDLGKSLEDERQALNDLILVHQATVGTYKEKVGLPVLKQHELGVPTSFAKKVPVEFEKKYEVKDTSIKEAEKGTEIVKGTLYDMLKYIGDLRAATNYEDNKLLIDKYIKDALVPFVESVRFPFTGVSSVQPYEAKLVQDLDKFAENVLMVPGVPELDFGKFKSIISSLEEHMKGLLVEREVLMGKSTTEDLAAAENLTKTINMIDKAISEVIPKYAAHQQKLDFDGDQIEIHAARTKEARQEIVQHLQHMKGTELTTERVFREKFTSGAVVGSTGEFTIAEMAKTFEKKFPVEKGFDFLKTPFLTKELEYLTPEKSLGMLSERKGMDPTLTLAKAVQGVVRNREAHLMFTEYMKEFGTGKTSKEVLSAANVVAENIEGIDEKIIQSAIKTQLYNEKYKDAIEAQLFKIHTGTETQALYRLHRLAELTVGFGPGQIGQGEYKPSPSFEGKFPASYEKVTGAAPGKEFHTMINEIVRFAIQKGMDVKHAGTVPVAGEMVKLIAKGRGGVEELWKNILDESDSSYSELRDFYGANKKVLERRAGGMKTGELVSSLSEIYEIEDLPKKELVGLGREELISKIVEQFGLKGFLNRLSDIVYEEAVNGLISQVESWTPETRARRGVKGDVSSWAENYVKKQTEDIRGINIRELIEEAQQPLYSMRTGMAAPKEELRKFKSKFGDLPMAEFPADAFSKEFRQEYMDKYQRAKATAKNIQRELEMFTSSSQGGAYADMLRATSKVMSDEQVQIEDIISGLEKRGYDINVEAGKSLVDRALKSLDKFPEYIKSILEIPDEIKRSKAIEELFKLASIPQITETEETARRFELYSSVFKEAERQLVKEKGYSRGQFDEEEFELLLEAKANELIERAMNLAQIDRALKGMSKKVYESRVLADLLPSTTAGAFVSTMPTGAQKTVMATAKERITKAKYGPKAGGPPVRPAGLPSGVDIGAGGIPQFRTGDVVPVRVVAVDGGVTIGISGISAKDLVAASVGKAAGQPEMDPDIFKKFDVLGEADKVYATLFKKFRSQEAPIFDKETVSTFERFSAGSLYTGGKFEEGFKFDPGKAFQDQVEVITDYIMGRLKDPDWASQLRMGLGTALHEKIQRRMEKSSLEQGKKLKFEKLIEDVETRGGPISGFADIVEYSVDNFGKEVVKKVSDIKTVSKFDIDELSKAVGGAKKASYGELVKKIEDPKVRGKLETAISQVNVYLKGLSEYAQGEILFFDRLKKGEEEPFVVEFGYSEERFQRDIDALIRAREVATEELSKKGVKVTKGVTPSGTKSTVTREYLMKREKDKPDITDKELDALIDTIITLLSKERLRPRKAASKEYSGLSEKVGKTIKNVREKEDRAKLYARTSYDEFIKPTPIAAGEGIKSVLENLRSLHDQALLYQQGKMLDFSVLKDFDKTIQDVITQVGKEGKSAAILMEAIDSVNALAVDPKEKIQGRDLMKLWKLYRIARGDWLLKKAEQAKKDLEAAEKVDDWRGANKAYGDLESAVEETQRFIAGSLGKMSDIYTEDKRFVYPGLAQAAGVYKDPRQIAVSAEGPLGDDERLQRVFKGMTRDFGAGREAVSPTSKIRSAFRDLTGMQKDMVDILTDAEKLKRVGPEIIEAWDFSKLAGDVSRLRAAMDQLARYNEFEADKRTNLDFMRKYLKKLESTYASLNLEMRQTTSLQKEWGQLDLMPVSKFETPTQQLALHERNIQKVREYFRTPEETGGPKDRERFSYPMKVFGDTGEVVKNVIVQFRKHGEGLDSAGEHVGKFVETQKDMIEWMQRSGASFESALRRVVMWGAASRLVYGGIAKLKSSLDEISAIEVSVAQLRMVMSPLETDFTKLQKAAIGFAKTYGLGVNDVLVSMKVFAQQGLSQEEVIDRTRVATLAANVTTLDSKAATEALTAAMKIFREEGTSAVRFLDAWSETEAKHAITAADMANAIKKSAAAAKTAGVTFDELNGIVAAIGSVTRQSGKEVGTAMRFIFRRLFSEKGPKALAEIGIPAITGEGELRRGFEVLNDLAGQWKDLTQAQKLNLAQSLGGTRQYNALIVLMDQWDEALRGIRNSTNSKGSAERRNLEIMKTYNKQLQQTKAAVSELKIGFGKIVLPSFKVGLKALKIVLETINALPTTVKAAAVAISSLFVLGAKGINIFSGISKYWKRGEAEITNLGKSFSKQMKIARFELMGKGAEKDIFGLKTALPSANKIANLYKPSGTDPVQMGKKWSDFHSIIGASVFKLRDWGLAYNKFLGDLGSGTGKLFKSSGDALQDFAKTLDKYDWKVSAGVQLGTFFTPGMFDDILSGMVIVGTEAAEKTSKYLGKALSFTGKTFGKGAELWLKSFAGENTNVVKALLPLGATVAAGAMAISKLSDKFNAATKSAQDFEKTMYGARRKSDSELKVIRELSQQYEILAKKLEDVNKAAKPETKIRRQKLGTYEAPLKTMRGMQQDLIGLSNSLADQNLSLISGYNELGNAVLRSSSNFGYFLKELDKVKVQDALETEITVINQYVRALTDIGSSEKIKRAFKDLASSMPVVGGLISKQIKVSPALVLKEASKELNRLVNIKNKYPLSTAVDEDIQRLQASLTEARDVFKETYSDLSRVFGDAFSKAGLKGLDKSDLEELFTRPELLEVFKIMVKMEPEFSLVKGVKPEDLMAKELLQLIYPQVAGVLDVDKLFTVSNFESMGKKISDGLKRGGRGIATFKFEEKILDTVWEKEELAKNLQIAGSQAILEFKQTTDGVYDWVATYFDTKTLQVKEVPFSEVSKFADAIFPLDSIKEDLTYRMDALNTFVAGAAAGLTGISVKDFKKDFDLGARFFSQIPTTLLLQGSKGFTPREAPESRYGTVKGMEKWGEEIKRFYFKPMEDLKTRLESVKRLQAPGLEDSVTLTAQFHSEVQKLLTTLKNNQAVFQFRALFVDLMKEFAESERVLRQNLAVQKKRNELDVETSGLMAGVSKALSVSNLGTRSFSELSPHQRLLLTDEKYKTKESEIKRLETTIQSNLEMVDKVERALVDLADMENIAKGFDVVLDPSQMDEFVEKVSKIADPGKFDKLIDINKNVATNTRDTVAKLDELIENIGTPESVSRIMKSSFTDVLQPRGRTVTQIERVARVRSKAEGRGDTETIIAANKALDVLSKRLLKEKGWEGATKAIRGSGSVLGRIDVAEFQQRLFAGMKPETFFKGIAKYEEGEKPWHLRGLLGMFRKGVLKEEDVGYSKEFSGSETLTDLKELQKESNKRGILNARNIATASASLATFTAFEKYARNKNINKLDEQIKQQDKLILQRRERGGDLAVQERDVRGLVKEREALVSERGKIQKKVDFYGLVSSMSMLEAGTTQLAMAMGLSEGQVKALGIGALGTYAAVKFAGSMFKEDLPDSVDKFGAKLKEVGKATLMKEKPDISGLKSLGKTMVKDIEKRRREVTGLSGEEIKKRTSEVDVEALRRKYQQDFGDLTALTERIKSSGTPGKDYSEEVRKQFNREIENIGERIEKKAAADPGVKRLQQALATFATATFSDYLAGMSDKKVLASTLEGATKDQSELISKVFFKWGDAAEKVLLEMYADTDKPADKVGKLATTTRSTVLNVGENAEEIKKAIEEYGRKVEEATKEAQKSLMRSNVNKAIKNAFEADRKVAEDALNEFSDYMISSDIAKRFRGPALLNKSLEGFTGEMESPLLRKDMSIQQRVFAGADKGLQNIISSVSTTSKGIELLSGNLEYLRKEAYREKSFIERNKGISDTYIIDRASDRHKELNRQIKKQTYVLGEFTDKLREFGQSKRYLDEFSGSIYKLNDAIREVSVSQSVEDLPGFRNMRNSIDKLLGGAHPRARYIPTVEEERMAGKQGMVIETRQDVERAQIMEQLRTATGKEFGALSQKLSDIDREVSRKIYTTDEQREVGRLKEQIGPYETFIGELEKVKQLPGLPEKQQINIGKLQEKMFSVIESSTEILPKDIKLDELQDAFFSFRNLWNNIRGRGIGLGEYKEEFEKIKRGKEYQYRGVSLKERRGDIAERVQEIRDSMVEALKEAPTFDMMEMQTAIADPVVEELRVIQGLLIEQSKEAGAKIDVSDLKTTIKNIGDILNSNKKAFGGRVVGPGGPKADRIPAMLSSGEYVVKTDSAKKLGYGALNYINDKGEIPRFAEGGFAWDKIFKTGSEGFANFRKSMKDKRLGLVDKKHEESSISEMLGYNVLRQAGLAAGEMSSMPIQSVLDIFSGAEGVARWQSSKSSKEMSEDVKNVVKNIKGSFNVEIVKKAIDAVKKEVSEGGTNLFGSIIEALIPGGAAVKAIKSIKGVGGVKLGLHRFGRLPKSIQSELEEVSRLYPTNIEENLKSIFVSKELSSTDPLGVYYGSGRMGLKKTSDIRGAVAHEYGHFAGDFDYSLWKKLKKNTLSDHEHGFIQLYTKFIDDMAFVRQSASKEIVNDDLLNIIEKSTPDDIVAKRKEIYNLKTGVPSSYSLKTYGGESPANIGMFSEMLSTAFEELRSPTLFSVPESVKLTEKYLKDRLKYKDLIEKHSMGGLSKTAEIPVSMVSKVKVLTPENIISKLESPEGTLTGNAYKMGKLLFEKPAMKNIFEEAEILYTQKIKDLGSVKHSTKDAHQQWFDATQRNQFFREAKEFAAVLKDPTISNSTTEAAHEFLSGKLKIPEFAEGGIVGKDGVIDQERLQKTLLGIQGMGSKKEETVRKDKDRKWWKFWGREKETDKDYAKSVETGKAKDVGPSRGVFGTLGHVTGVVGRVPGQALYDAVSWGTSGVKSLWKDTKTLGERFGGWTKKQYDIYSDPENYVEAFKSGIKDPLYNELMKDRDLFVNKFRGIKDFFVNSMGSFKYYMGEDAVPGGYKPTVTPKSKRAHPTKDNTWLKTLKWMADVTPSGISGKMEGIYSMLSGGFGTVAGGLAGIARLPFGLEQAAKNVDRVSKMLTYTPQKEKGTESLDMLAAPFQWYGSIGDKIGNEILDVTGSPNKAAFISSLFKGAPALAALSMGTSGSATGPAVGYLARKKFTLPGTSKFSKKINAGIKKATKTQEYIKGLKTQKKRLGSDKAYDGLRSKIEEKLAKVAGSPTKSQIQSTALLTGGIAARQYAKDLRDTTNEIDLINQEKEKQFIMYGVEGISKDQEETKKLIPQRKTKEDLSGRGYPFKGVPFEKSTQLIKVAYGDTIELLKKYDSGELREAMQSEYTKNLGKEFGDSLSPAEQDRFEKVYTTRSKFVSKQYLQARKALENTSLSEEKFLTPENMLLHNKVIRDSVFSFQTLKTIKEYDRAKVVGGYKKAGDYYKTDPNLFSQYRSQLKKGDITEERKSEYEKMFERLGKAKHVFTINPKEYNSFRDRVISGKITDDEVKSFIDKPRDTTIAAIRRRRVSIYNPDTMKDIMEAFGAKKSTDRSINIVSEQERGGRIGTEGGAKFGDRLEGASRSELIKLIKEFQKSNKLSEGGSLPQYAQGGPVTKTGPLFAHKGEYILSKGYNEGGMVTAATLNTPTATFDSTELLSKLEAIELKVEDKELKVEDKKLKVDDTYKVQVDEPDWKIGVDIPTDVINVKVDVEDAATRLNSAIAAALDKSIKVEYTGDIKAVGAEKLDKLTELINKVDNKLLNVKVNLEDKINMITTDNDILQINTKINEMIQSQTASIERQIADNRTDVSASRGEIVRVEMRMKAMLDDIDSRLRMTQNFATI